MCDFYFPYYGSKRKEYPHIRGMVDEFLRGREDAIFVEPFCGSCAVSLKVSREWSETFPGLVFHVNDANRYFVRILREIKERGTSAHLFDYTNTKNETITREAFIAGAILDKKQEATVLDQFYYAKCYEIRKYEFGRGTMVGKVKKHSRAHRMADAFFAGALITHADYKKILEQYHDNPDACLFLDPPYLDSCNVSYTGYGAKQRGEIVDNTAMYIEALRFFESCRCRFIMIINANAINRHLYGRWIKAEYKKTYSGTGMGKAGNRSTSHLVISNIGCPL